MKGAVKTNTPPATGRLDEGAASHVLRRDDWVVPGGLIIRYSSWRR